jgi:hypothetical protein
MRDEIAPVFKDWDANVTQRFQDAADFRRQWEPYQQAGISQVDPALAEWLVQFSGILDQPAAMQAWFEGYAQQHGLTPQQQQEEQQVQIDPYADPTDLQQQLSSVVEKQLQQLLEPVTGQLGQLAEWREAQEAQAAQQQAQSFIDSEFARLEKDHGQPIPRDQVELHIGKYIEMDPEHAIERAWRDHQAMVGQIEKDLLASKLGQPPAAEGGGVPAVAPDRLIGPDVLKQAGLQAAERIRQMRQP